MEEKQVLETLKKIKESPKKRNFVQSVDYSIILKEIDLNKPEGKIDIYITLPAPNGKVNKICALIDKELQTDANKVFDKVITKDEFSAYKNKNREIRKLAREYDFFVAQATIMTDIAAVFGKILGSAGKMPSPKAGCVVPPKFSLEPLKHKLMKTIRLRTNKQPVISALVGKEDSSEADIAKNVQAVYNAIKAVLPRGEQQIKKTYLKTTMGKPVAVSV
jgi:large subunit ribosomal protein L1